MKIRKFFKGTAVLLAVSLFMGIIPVKEGCIPAEAASASADEERLEQYAVLTRDYGNDDRHHMAYVQDTSTGIVYEIVGERSLSGYNWEWHDCYAEVRGQIREAGGTLDASHVTVTEQEITSGSFGEVIIAPSVTYERNTYVVNAVAEGAFYGNSRIKSLTYDAGSYKAVNIKEIRDYAFACSAMESMNLSDCRYLEEISPHMFEGSAGLQNMALPAGITAVGDYAFSLCSSLNITNMAECSRVESVGKYAFRGTAVTGIDFTKFRNLQSIGRGAFAGCANLTAAKLPETLSCIEAFTFSNCPLLAEINWQDLTGLTSIGDNAFGIGEKKKNSTAAGSLKSVDLAGCTKLVSIGSEAFLNARQVKSFSLPQSVKKIGNFAFYSLGSGTPEPFSISIQGDIKIGDHAFACSKITGVEILAESRDGGVKTADSAFEESSLQAFWVSEEVPGTVLLSIGASAFKNCKDLSSFFDTKEETLYQVEISSIGSSAFWGTVSLKHLPDAKLSVDKIPSDAFFASGITGIRYTEDNGMMYSNKITIPASVAEIQSRAFYLHEIQTANPEEVIRFYFPEDAGLKLIAEDAFGRFTGPDEQLYDNAVSKESLSADTSWVVFYCYPGSYAEQYAKAHNIKCCLMDAAEEPPSAIGTSTRTSITVDAATPGGIVTRPSITSSSAIEDTEYFDYDSEQDADKEKKKPAAPRLTSYKKKILKGKAGKNCKVTIQAAKKKYTCRADKKGIFKVKLKKKLKNKTKITLQAAKAGVKSEKTVYMYTKGKLKKK